MKPYHLLNRTLFTLVLLVVGCAHHTTFNRGRFADGAGLAVAVATAVIGSHTPFKTLACYPSPKGD